MSTTPYTANLIERLRASNMPSELLVETVRELEALSRRLAKAQAEIEETRSKPQG